MLQAGHTAANRLAAATLPFLLFLGAACGGGRHGEPWAESSSEIVFTNVTESAGLGAFRHVTGAIGDKWMPETYGSGAGFLDYDRDGLPDILLVGGGAWTAQSEEKVRSLQLFRNVGGGRFEDVTEHAGLSDISDYGFGVASADYDRDGDPDIFFTTLGTDRLLRNDDGAFTDVTDAAGVGGPSAWSSAAVFFDANRDGLVDLFVGGYVLWSPEGDVLCSSRTGVKVYCTPQLYRGAPGRFYINRGDGGFRDATTEYGFGHATGKTLGALSTDYDMDGWPDLYVTNDTNPDQLFRNAGGDGFEEIGIMSGISFDERGRPRAGMGVAAGYVDGSGRPTLFVGNFASEMIGAYRYADTGLFEDVAAPAGIGRPSLRTLTFGLALTDVDLDGDQDLVAANGHIFEEVEESRDNTSYRQIPHLFLNDGAGIFTDAGESVFGQAIVARGLAVADFDRDGDQDLLFTESGGRAHLWRNDVRGHDHVRISLVGTESPIDGIGARIEAWAGSKKLTREVRAGTSYLSQDELPVTLGLGDARTVDSLIVAWPSGTVTLVTDVPAGSEVVIREDAGLLGSE